MSFSTEWLDLREGADNAARDASMLADVRAFLARSSNPVVVDLGSGTGSTLRAIGDVEARWRLVRPCSPKPLADQARRSRPSSST